MTTASLAPSMRPPIRRIAWPFGVRKATDVATRAHVTPEPDIVPPAGPQSPDPGPDEAPIPMQDPPPVVPDPGNPAHPPLHALTAR